MEFANLSPQSDNLVVTPQRNPPQAQLQPVPPLKELLLFTERAKNTGSLERMRQQRGEMFGSICSGDHILQKPPLSPLRSPGVFDSKFTRLQFDLPAPKRLTLGSSHSGRSSCLPCLKGEAKSI